MAKLDVNVIEVQVNAEMKKEIERLKKQIINQRFYVLGLKKTAKIELSIIEENKWYRVRFLKRIDAKKIIEWCDEFLERFTVQRY